jgi:predicted ribosome quality control (RQC) complex YloA/Tae2 family protein
LILDAEGKPKDFTYQTAEDSPCKTMDSFSDLLETFYAAKATGELMRRRGSELQRTLTTLVQRITRRTAAQEQERWNADDRDIHRQRGDMITASLHLLTRGMDSARVPDYTAEPSTRC